MRAFQALESGIIGHGGFDGIGWLQDGFPKSFLKPLLANKLRKILHKLTIAGPA
jgi:hypothetical protein